MEERSVDELTVASPCRVPWDSMRGDERVRFCAQCRLHVVNVAEMTREEVEGMFRRRGERVCGRLHRRPDGTVVTRDCLTVAEAIARRVRRVRVALASALGVAGLAGCTDGPRRAVTTTGVFAWPVPATTPRDPPPSDGRPADPPKKSRTRG
jgi:hypothetical protein